MIIFKTAENFCGFLFFTSTAAGLMIVSILVLLEGYRKVKELYTVIRGRQKKE